MKTELPQTDTFHSVFLTGTIMLAGIDVTNMLEYVLRIILGAVIVSVSQQIKIYWQNRKKKKQATIRLKRIRKIKRSSHGIGQ